MNLFPEVYTNRRTPLKVIPMRKLNPKEAVAHVFASYDQTMAAQVIAWLDHCGYQIVEKDQVSVVPPDPVKAEHRRAHNEVH
jgi:hypothetical protein